MTTPRNSKTQLCWHFSYRKVCPRGLSCTFAHGEEELRPESERKLCYLYDPVEQTCPRGEKCPFAHPNGLNASKPAVKNQICKFWKQGICKNGSTCINAHGEEELRSGIVEKAKATPEFKVYHDEKEAATMAEKLKRVLGVASEKPTEEVSPKVEEQVVSENFQIVFGTQRNIPTGIRTVIFPQHYGLDKEFPSLNKYRFEMSTFEYHSCYNCELDWKTLLTSPSCAAAHTDKSFDYALFYQKMEEEQHPEKKVAMQCIAFCILGCSFIPQ